MYNSGPRRRGEYGRLSVVALAASCLFQASVASARWDDDADGNEDEVENDSESVDPWSASKEPDLDRPTVMFGLHLGTGAGMAFGFAGDIRIIDGFTAGFTYLVWLPTLSGYGWRGPRLGYVVRQKQFVFFPYFGIGEVEGGNHDAYYRADEVDPQVSPLAGARFAYVNGFMVGFDLSVNTKKATTNVPPGSGEDPGEERTRADMLVLLTLGAGF